MQEEAIRPEYKQVCTNSNMTRLCMAFEFAITEDDDADSEGWVDVAKKLVSGLDKDQVNVCKRAVEKALDLDYCAD
jgi:hypothetical protein